MNLYVDSEEWWHTCRNVYFHTVGYASYVHFLVMFPVLY